MSSRTAQLPAEARVNRFDVPVEPITASILVVAAGVVWIVGSNPLLGAGIFLGAVLRLVLPTHKYIAATLVLAPVLFAIDRYNAPIAYQVLGYRQIFGAGAGIYLAMLATGLIGPSRLRPWPIDAGVGLMFLLLAVSIGFPDADLQAGAIFCANTLPLIGAYFGARRLGKEGTDLVLDAIVAAAAVAVIGRWLQEGPGVSTEFYRAGTNWYFGPAVYGSLPLVLGWALALPALFRVASQDSRLRTLGRYSALALLSAELAFLQVKTVFVVLAICAFVFMRISRQKDEGRIQAPLTMQRLVLWMFILLLVTFVYSILNERVGTIYESFWGNESDRLRLDSMVEHLRLVLARPLGYGFSGLYETALPQTAQTSHNAFIDIAGDASIIAAIALGLSLVMGGYLILKKGRELTSHTEEWRTWTRIALGATALVSAILINGSTLYREFPIPSAVLPFVFFGLAIAWCTRKTEQAQSQIQMRDAPP
jgi:hypothetical protein